MQTAKYCSIRILLDPTAALDNIGHTVLFMFVLPTRSRWNLLLAALLLFHVGGPESNCWLLLICPASRSILPPPVHEQGWNAGSAEILPLRPTQWGLLLWCTVPSACCCWRYRDGSELAGSCQVGWWELGGRGSVRIWLGSRWCRAPFLKQALVLGTSAQAWGKLQQDPTLCSSLLLQALPHPPG